MFDIILHFIIQKLKNKRTFLKNIQTEKAEEPIIVTEREEIKTRYFPPQKGRGKDKLQTQACKDSKEAYMAKANRRDGLNMPLNAPDPANGGGNLDTGL